MAKDIVIQEGGQARTLSDVKKLETELEGGGSCYWIPQDEAGLTTKHITENGEYAATSDGAYGYSMVTVNVASSYVSGYGEDGNEYVVTVDENTDQIIETLVPSSIQITSPPSTIDYNNGEAIDFSGLVVKAFDGNGNLYEATGYPGGVIPISELQLPVTVAIYADD